MNNQILSSVPDENKMEELLANIQPVPSKDFYQKMTRVSWRATQKKQSGRIASSARMKLAVAVTILLVAATVIFTPQGRAFAQDILKLFNRAESDVIPLRPEQIISAEDAQSMPTAMPPAPLVSVTEAEQTAGFDAKELPAVPDGFVFVGAMGTPGSITIEFEARGGGGALIINESIDGFIQSEWDQAPVEAISQVRVGDVDAEIVQGLYVVYAGETVGRWNPDAPVLRLRWIEDGIWFEMTKHGGVEAIASLDQSGLIALAESMK